MGDSETDEYGYTIDCSTDPWASNEPLRYKFTQNSDTVSCGWPWAHTIARCCAGLFGGVFPVLAIGFGLFKKKPWVIWTVG